MASLHLLLGMLETVRVPGEERSRIADTKLPGNFHALILYRTPEEEGAAHAAEDRMVKRALALGGTCKSGKLRHSPSYRSTLRV